MTIGEQITALRKARKWPRRTVALMTGYSEQSIINWERGTYTPSRDAVRALEKAFGERLQKEENDED